MLQFFFIRSVINVVSIVDFLTIQGTMPSISFQSDTMCGFFRNFATLVSQQKGICSDTSVIKVGTIKPGTKKRSTSGTFDLAETIQKSNSNIDSDIMVSLNEQSTTCEPLIQSTPNSKVAKGIEFLCTVVDEVPQETGTYTDVSLEIEISCPKIGKNIMKENSVFTGVKDVSSVDLHKTQITILENNLSIDSNIDIMVSMNDQSSFCDDSLETPLTQSTPKPKVVKAGVTLFKEMQELLGEHFNASSLDCDSFSRNLGRLTSSNRMWNKRRYADYKLFYTHFSVCNWEKLGELEKKKHSISDCKECKQRHFDIWKLFPKKSHKGKSIDFEMQELTGKEPPKDGAKKVYDAVNASFYPKYGVSFAEALTNVKSLPIQKKVTTKEKQAHEKKLIKKVANNIQGEFDNIAVDKCFGTRLSISKWDLQRKIASFETRVSAEKRVKVGGSKNESYDHVGDISKMNFDKEGLVLEATSWTPTTKVNWSVLARKYKILNRKGEIAANGGSIAKAYLLEREKEGMHLQFKDKDVKKTIVRRKRKTIPDCGNVPMPLEMNPKKLKKQVLQEIMDRNINIGKAIVPRKYKKYKLDKNGHVVNSEFVVEGRKVPLLEIRQKHLHDNIHLMRLHPDSYFDALTYEEVCDKLKGFGESTNLCSIEELQSKMKRMERTRHIQLWHDGSTIANHSHIVFNVNIMYDTAVYLTDIEYFAKFGRRICVQSVVEKPQLYIIARCRSNDEQLGYVDTRVECLKDLKKDLEVGGINISDVMRMFHGDGPAVQFESGQQKGGNYFCAGCGVNRWQADDIQYTYHLPIISLLDKQQLILKGVFGKKKSLEGKEKPFKDLSAAQLKKEIHSRNVLIGNKTTKKELTTLLKKTLKGHTRLPVLLSRNPIQGIVENNLLFYEFSLLEPMHDIGGHIANIFEELPHHLDTEDKKLFSTALAVAYEGKETKRTCDKRQALLLVYLQMDEHSHNGNALRMLRTLCDIQRILYLGEANRTTKEILRLHNSCFEHYKLVKQVLGFNLKAVSREKLYGKYFHGILVHAPLQLRIISGRSLNTEGDERYFGDFKSITNTTSSLRPDHIIVNGLIRHGVEGRCKELYHCTRSDIESQISKLSLQIQHQYNTTVPYAYIQHNIHEWQSHLERISDYLEMGAGAWWEKTAFGIEFKDSPSEMSDLDSPSLHHFRSSNVKEIQQSLVHTWDSIVKSKITIPSHLITTGTSQVEYFETGYLLPHLTCKEKDVRVHSEVVNEPLHDESDTSSCDGMQEVLNFLEEEDMDQKVNGDNTVLKSSETDIDFVNETSIAASDVPKYKNTFENSLLGSMNDCKLNVSHGVNGNKTTSAGSSQTVTVDGLLTQEGRDVKVVLDFIPDNLRKYDKLNFQLQECKVLSSDRNEDMLDYLAPLQTSVCRTLTDLREKLNKFDIEFMSQNTLRLPKLEDWKKDKSVVETLGRITLAERLLRQWEIKF